MQSKLCTKCDNMKPLTEYHRAKSGALGRYSICKKCKNAQTRAYLKTTDGKQARLRANKKYYQSKKGKQQKATDQRVYINRYAEKHRAHGAVAVAVTQGKIQRAAKLACNKCDNKAIEYHHHNGYAPEHWLDVIPLCKSCHQEIHVIEKILCKDTAKR